MAIKWCFRVKNQHTLVDKQNRSALKQCYISLRKNFSALKKCSIVDKQYSIADKQNLFSLKQCSISLKKNCCALKKFYFLHFACNKVNLLFIYIAKYILSIPSLLQIKQMLLAMVYHLLNCVGGCVFNIACNELSCAESA